MAHQLQAVAALLLFGSAAYAVPFSHRKHLSLKLACLTCHASAARSTKVEDNNLPRREICLGCHGGKGAAPALPGGPRIKAPTPTLVAKFSHQQHLKLGAGIAAAIAVAIDSKAYLSPPGDTRRHLNTKNACEACHRGLAESDAVTRDAFPRMADCLVCHGKIDPPFSCTTCHAESQQLKPADHKPDFIDTHSTPKVVKTSCAVCHGRRFTCLGCH